MTATRKYQQWIALLAIVSGLALGSIGCADKITGVGQTQKVAVNLSLKAGPAVSFQLTVTAADIDTIRAFMAPTDEELVTVVEVPLGANRHFLVEGLDLQGVVLYRGETVTDVIAIEPLDLTIDMPPVVPMIYLIPHISTVTVGNDFVISVCANDLVGLRNAGFGLSLNGAQQASKLFDSAVITSVELDPSQKAFGTVLDYGQEGSTDVFISLFSQTGPIVDENGDACLVNIHCTTQNAWLTEPIELIPAMFLENLDGIELDPGAVYLDAARLRIFRERTSESYLGTDGADTGVSLVPLGNGELMLAGTTIKFGPDESQENFLYLAQLDAALQPRFERLLPWSSFGTTFGLARSPGGFHVVGTSGQGGGEVLFVDDAGSEIWRQSLGANRQSFDVAARSGGGCVVSGRWQNDGLHFFLAAFEPDGSFVTFQPADFSSNDVFQAVVALDDTTFVAVGMSQQFSAPTRDLTLGKFTLGQGFSTVWQRKFPSEDDRAAVDLLATDDGGFLAVGLVAATSGSPRDVLAIKYDADGALVWQRIVDTLGDDIGIAVAPAVDGGYVITGTTTAFSRGPQDILAIKLNSIGEVIWQRVQGSAANEQARDIVRVGDGFVVTGASDNGPISGQDILMLRLDSEGR